MIYKISISNFKSVRNLDLELSRFNVLIGENGSGKSNILESITFLGAFLNDKLDNEFLFSRGIRTTEGIFFKSHFQKIDLKKPLMFSLWINGVQQLDKYKIFFEKNKWISEFEKKKLHALTFKKYLEKRGANFSETLKKMFQYFDDLKRNLDKIKNEKEKKIKRDSLIKLLKKAKSSIEAQVEKKALSLDKFLIYSPENSSLRNFSEEGQILPIGVKGEGLFKELKRLNEKKNKKQIATIIKSLKLLDWFDSLEIPSTSFSGENILKIQDRFLDTTVKYLDQKNVNEGFLFILFYLTIIVSENTPTFFAIDNIDSSLNPKLCSELIRVLDNLSKLHKKHLIITTHNPFILDGLDLHEDEQRLFVVRRNLEGHTIATRVPPSKSSSVKLSEAWMTGYLGGLPNNF